MDNQQDGSIPFLIDFIDMGTSMFMYQETHYFKDREDAIKWCQDNTRDGTFLALSE